MKCLAIAIVTTMAFLITTALLESRLRCSGRNHPVGVIHVGAAVCDSATRRHSVDAFSEHVTKDIVQVLQGTIILFVAAEAFFRGPLQSWVC